MFTPTPVMLVATSTPVPLLTSTPAPTAVPLVRLETPGTHGHPTLVDFWEGRALFVVDVPVTGLPLGESETLLMRNGELWSYVHASAQSAGIVDQCGDPVPFPGCVVRYRSTDGGYTFQLADPVCLFGCAQCPCDSEGDHVDQQQYPRLAYDGETLFLVYEYRGRVRLRRSTDGVTWGPIEVFPNSTIWKRWLRPCHPEENIGPHPFVPYDYECLAGGPPGIYIEDKWVYIFMALGQNPGSMGCYYGTTRMPTHLFARCRNAPLFVGAEEYGPLEERGPATNPYFDFRTISSAKVQRIGERYYMLYEGVRGPGPGDYGDSQFALGLARSLTDQIDGPWEKYPGNPLLVDLPGNVGLGHADLIVIEGQTVLYTSLDGATRSRLLLVWAD